MSQRKIDKLMQQSGRKVGACIQEWSLINEGDRVLVAFSGGKDSIALLHLLQRAQRVAPIAFELLAIHVNHGHPAFPGENLVRYVESLGIACEVVHQNTGAVLRDKLEPGHSPCSLCSRLRRGIIYTAAKRLNCNKIALGHHREDAIETLLLNLFYSGQLKAMPALLTSDDGRNQVIRPMLYVPEAELVEIVAQLGVEVLASAACGFEPRQQRSRMGELLDGLSAENPKIKSNALAALNVWCRAISWTSACYSAPLRLTDLSWRVLLML